MTFILGEDGRLNPLIKDDVRIEPPQERTLMRIAKADSCAEVVGMDNRGLPVVRARLGGAKRPSDSAVFAKGRTTRPELPLVDEWELDAN